MWVEGRGRFTGVTGVVRPDAYGTRSEVVLRRPAWKSPPRCVVQPSARVSDLGGSFRFHFGCVVGGRWFGEAGQEQAQRDGDEGEGH